MDHSSKGFQWAAHVILCLAVIAVILPLMLIVASSLTEETTLIREGYRLWPSQPSVEAYRVLFGKSGTILNAYGVTFTVTAIGTCIGLMITVMLGYALSVPDLPFRRAMSFYVFFTMLFSGGLVPTYMMYTGVFHVNNTIWALIVPQLLVNAFSVIIARSFFATGIPSEVLEAARIDGAGEFRIFFRIVMPMGIAIMATLGLIIALAYWNNWTNGLYYISDRKLYSIQQTMTEMVRNMQALQSGVLGSQAAEGARIPSTALRMATAVCGAVPILIIYPLFQKYFVKGVTLGAVKG